MLSPLHLPGQDIYGLQVYFLGFYVLSGCLVKGSIFENNPDDISKRLKNYECSKVTEIRLRIFVSIFDSVAQENIRDERAKCF